MSSAGGWEGTQVRNKDGREGIIEADYAVLCYRTLTIRVSDGSSEIVELNGEDADTGAIGWEWYCADFDGGPRWLDLGKQS